MSKSIVIAGALLTTLSFATYAQDSSVCSDPLQRICKDTELQRAQRNIYVNRLKSEIAKEASVRAAPRIEEMKKNISKLRFIKRAIEGYKIRNQEIMSAAKKRIVGIEEVVTNKESVALIKDYMNQAIDQSRFDLATKMTMKSIVRSTIVGNFGDFIERTNMDDNILAQLMSNACGSDGLIDNAFATTLGKDRYVLICPGFLITLTQTADLTERFNSILQAIAHEMGHHIDNSQLGNDLYNPYLTCLANNYSGNFNRTKEDDKFCKKNEKDPAACKMQVTISHAGELIADAWGIKVLNLHARKQNYSFAETDLLLTNSWTKLCGSGDEGIHPSGDFRIGTLLRTDPDITQYLACDNASAGAQTACTFDGEISI